MENWKTIAGFEDYSVSDQGRVRNNLTGRTIKPGLNGVGYNLIGMRTNGKSKIKTLHRLVAENFIPNPDNKPDVNHKNGVKTDNRLENLEWCTESENNIHAFKTGLFLSSKLTEVQVLEIRELLTRGSTQKKIGDQFGVSISIISKIKLGTRWAHV